ncbi:hypothetical protein MHA_1843 [Mannheimia haemolytica PHL213]|nr:hypothetical protein MHA_1843 [Mannheimia haemolytica PHL213]
MPSPQKNMIKLNRTQFWRHRTKKVVHSTLSTHISKVVLWHKTAVLCCIFLQFE